MKDSDDKPWVTHRVPDVAGNDEDLGPCASRVTVKSVAGFHAKYALEIAKGEEPRKVHRSFNYSHIGFMECDVGNQWFIIEVNEPEKWRIRVEGRSLWKLYNYLLHQRLEWVQPVVGRADMGIGDGVPVILRVSIQRIEDTGEE